MQCDQGKRLKAESMKDGIRLAAELIDSGKALEKIKEMIEVSNG